MQTIKPRARWLKGGTGQMWELSHPDTTVKVWSALPRDGAALLLEQYVAPNLAELAAGSNRGAA
ncbi:TPA: hypothetical protein QDA78_005649 [Burkholderia vietnamiensis]|nr:hypothetical protein [Burkholderia vietnamiensis]